jgi:hypothetical protein
MAATLADAVGTYKPNDVFGQCTWSLASAAKAVVLPLNSHLAAIGASTIAL